SELFRFVTMPVDLLPASGSVCAAYVRGALDHKRDRCALHLDAAGHFKAAGASAALDESVFQRLPMPASLHAVVDPEALMRRLTAGDSDVAAGTAMLRVGAEEHEQ